MSRKNRNKMIVIAIAILLPGSWLSTVQGHFYSDAMLLKVAMQQRDKAFSRKHCDEVKLLGTESAPSRGIKLFSWACLSKSGESTELSIRIEDDGYPDALSTPLACSRDSTIERQGFLCEKN